MAKVCLRYPSYSSWVADRPKLIVKETLPGPLLSPRCNLTLGLCRTYPSLRGNQVQNKSNPECDSEELMRRQPC